MHHGTRQQTIGPLTISSNAVPRAALTYLGIFVNSVNSRKIPLWGTPFRGVSVSMIQSSYDGTRFHLD